MNFTKQKDPNKKIGQIPHFHFLNLIEEIPKIIKSKHNTLMFYYLTFQVLVLLVEFSCLNNLANVKNENVTIQGSEKDSVFSSLFKPQISFPQTLSDKCFIALI